MAHGVVGQARIRCRLAPQLAVAPPDGVRRPGLLPTGLLIGIVEGPAVDEVHRQKAEAEGGQGLLGELAVLQGAEVVHLGAGDEFDLRVPGAGLVDFGQVGIHHLRPHGEVLVGVEGRREREVLSEGEGGEAGGRGGISVLGDGAGAVAGIDAMAMGVYSFHLIALLVRVRIRGGGAVLKQQSPHLSTACPRVGSGRKCRAQTAFYGRSRRGF